MGAAHSKRRDSFSQKDYRISGTGRPSPPGKPFLASDASNTIPDVLIIQWEAPFDHGGSRIIGYLVEHRRTGSPHWVRATPTLVQGTELMLSGLEPGWRYHFRVSAENANGLSEPGPLSEPFAVTLHRHVASAPFFYQELQDTTALENEKVEFTVKVQGMPMPQIAWYHDGFEIFSNRRQRIVTSSEASSLIIYEAAMSDEGEIKCTATNRAGHAVSRAKLILEAPPTIRLSRQYEDGLIFEKDEIIRLKVYVGGRPPPFVCWYHNGEPITHGGRYELSFVDRYATLRVAEGKRCDRGEYTVRAYNNISEDAASFLVTVTDRPEAPESIQVVMTLGRSVTLSWSEPKDDGGCKIGNYIIEYNRIGWNVWLKAATCRQLTTTLVDLIEGSKYRFRVKAENPYGVSEPSRESDIIFIPDPKRGLLEPPGADANGRLGNVDHESYLSDFDDLAIAPPMSLSAPELGSCDYPEDLEIRNAVSSTELLHEKAMARFYQAFTEDEMDRLKKLERRHSFGSRTSLGKNKQMSEMMIENRLQKVKISEKDSVAKEARTGSKRLESVKSEVKTATKVAAPEKAERKFKPEMKAPKPIPEVADRTVPSEVTRQKAAEEVSHRRFAPEINEPKSWSEVERQRSPTDMRGRRATSEAREQSSALEEQILSVKLKQPLKIMFGANVYNSSLEADGASDVLEEEEEEDYDFDSRMDSRRPLITETFDEVEELEESGEEFFEEPEPSEPYRPRSTSMTVKHAESAYSKNAMPKATLGDTETYHPRNMIPVRRPETEVPLSQNNLEVVRSRTSRSRSPSPRDFGKPGAEMRVSAETEIKPPPRVSSLPREHPRSQQNTFDEIIVPPDVKLPSTNTLEISKVNGTKMKSESSILKPILKRRPSDVVEDTGGVRMAPIASVEPELNLIPKALSSEAVGEDRERRTGRRVRIEEPENNLDRRSKSVNFYDETDFQSGRRSSRSGVENEPKNVLISHYSDIVREFGRLKKAPKTLYLNYEDLKAAALNSEASPVVESTEKDETVTEEEVEEKFVASNGAEVESPVELEMREKDVSPPRIQLSPEEEEKLLKVEKKVSSICDYVMDLCLFLVACYFYFFGNALYSIPFLVLMLCRQLQESVQEKIQRWRKPKSE